MKKEKIQKKKIIKKTINIKKYKSYIYKYFNKLIYSNIKIRK